MASDLSIHFMERAEATDVEGLLERTFGIKFGPTIEDAFNTEDPLRPVIFSAVENGKVVGTITCHFMDESLGLIGRLAVDDTCRGRGIGNRLVAKAEEFMGSEWMHGSPGTVGLMDETKVRNPASQFYEHLGYAPSELMPSLPSEPFLAKSINVQPK